jgi:hypothetical protein
MLTGWLLAAAVLFPAPALAQVPGAEYTGIIDGGGTVKLSVRSTGTEILDFRAFSVPGQSSSGACSVGLAGLYLAGVPIVGNAFSRHDPSGELDFDGTFPSPQQAQGTLNITHDGCATGPKSWSASTTAVAPPPSGSASGSISKVHAIPGGRVSATYTTTFSLCTSSGYCGWYAHALQLPAARACTVDTSHLTYVGDSHATSGSETKTATFSPAFTGGIRLCLYARQGGTEHLVAQTVFTPPVARGLSLARAQTVARQALARRFGSRYTRGSGYRRSCARSSSLRVRCAVSWRYSRDRYRGTVTVWLTSPSATRTYYTVSVVRTRR